MDDKRACWDCGDITIKLICESCLAAALREQRQSAIDRMLAKVGMKYPDQYDRFTDKVIRDIESIIRAFGEEVRDETI